MKPPVKLPEVNGKYRVGLSHLNFIDHTRQVPFPEHDNHFRDIPVMIWYPAKTVEGYQPRLHGSRRAIEAEINGVLPYLPPQAGEAFKSLSQYREIITNSYMDAPILDGNDLPIVFYSHGYTGYLWLNQIQCEHLASHGYIVIAFGVPQNGHFEYPDGRFEPVSPGVYKEYFTGSENGTDLEHAEGIIADRKNRTPVEIGEATKTLYVKCMPFLHQRMDYWYEDFLFVLKNMQALNSSGSGSPFSGKMNLNRIGLFGMSMGGGLASLIAYRKTPANVAGTLSLDGAHYGIPYDAKIEMPHMIVQSSERSWLLFERMDKNAWYVTIPGAAHMNFTDAAYVNPGGFGALGLVTDIDQDQLIQIMNTSVLAFFDHTVRGMADKIREELQNFPGIEIETK